MSSPYAVGGETGYTAHEDLKCINGYNVGEGKEDNGLVFLFLHSKKTLVGFICSFILGSPQEIDREKPSTAKQLKQTDRIKISLKENKTKTGEKPHKPHRRPSEKHKREETSSEEESQKRNKSTIWGCRFCPRRERTIPGKCCNTEQAPMPTARSKNSLNNVLFPDRGGIRC